MIISLLNTTLDPSEVLRKKRSLKRKLSEQKDLSSKRIAILGGSTTNEITEILEIFLLENKIRPVFYECEYAQFQTELAFKNEALEKFSPELIYIHTTIANINIFPEISDRTEDVEEKLANQFLIYESLYTKAGEYYQCPIIVNNFENPFTRPLGNLESSDYRGKIRYINLLNEKLYEYVRSHKNFYIHDINYLSSWIGLQKWFNRKDWYAYKYALSVDCIPQFCHSLTSIVRAILGGSKKVLVLDLDNTLWGGVIGDDGVDGIQIGPEHAVGEAFTEFQTYLKELKKRGVILTVASKNESETARLGFTHPFSVLKEEDFASFSANWQPKSENLQTIANDLCVGMDSMVFVDDNPAEQELLRQVIPQVITLNMSRNVEDYISTIDKSGLFEPIAISKEDLERSNYYKDNAIRKKLEHSFLDYEKYLESLQMEAKILPFDFKSIARITQLINKTNQFNLTTIRYSTTEIDAIIEDKTKIALYGELKDKFGDNGLISVLIANIRLDKLEIDLWIMSCRVFKRQMELAMLDEVISISKSLNIYDVYGTYIPTKKNSFVAELYSSLGFASIGQDQTGASKWHYRIPTIESKHNMHIKVN
jgi:FkbH-like protein